MQKLTIIKEKWLRGSGNSFLLHAESGKMCCLGFCALQAGYTEEEIADKLSPQSVAYDSSTTKGSFVNLVSDPYETGKYYNDDVCLKLMRENDAEHINDEQRMKNLAQLFKEIDIEVEFV